MLMNDDLVMCLSVWGSTLADRDNEPLVHAQSIFQSLWLVGGKKEEVEGVGKSHVIIYYTYTLLISAILSPCMLVSSYCFLKDIF